MSKASALQKAKSKKHLVNNLREQLTDLKLKHHQAIKEFETKQYILKHLINDAELYGTISAKKYFNFDVRECSWCGTSFFDTSKSKNQRFCRNACKSANYRKIYEGVKKNA